MERFFSHLHRRFIYRLTEDKICVENNWLFYSSTNLLTSYNSTQGIYIYVISGLGQVTIDTSITERPVHPTLYLKPSVEIVSGTGKEDDAYKLE